jgi:hypothetical protein
MRPSRIGVLGVVFVLLGGAHAAHATINLTGHWNLKIDAGGFGTFFQAWDITQGGTSLTQTPSSSGQPGPRTGTIDSASGAFTLADPVTCFPAIGPSSCTFTGTAATDGQSFTGTYDCVVPTPTHCGGPGSASVIAVRAPTTCGNGTVDAGEDCDEGGSTGLPGSCCSLACTFAPSGTSCATSGNACMPSDTCDGAGNCVAVAGPPVTCDACSACDPGSGACVPSPATSCHAPDVAGAASISLKTTGPLLRWKWRKGDAIVADFGDPTGTDTYTLCVYDASNGGGPTTRLVLTIPPGPAWHPKPTGFVYRDKLGTAAGVTGIILEGALPGKAKIAVKASGSNLSLPALPPVPPVKIQLRSHGLCWGADYDAAGVKKATDTRFVAKSAP